MSATESTVTEVQLGRVTMYKKEGQIGNQFDDKHILHNPKNTEKNAQVLYKHHNINYQLFFDKNSTMDNILHLCRSEVYIILYFSVL